MNPKFILLLAIFMVMPSIAARSQQGKHGAANPNGSGPVRFDVTFVLGDSDLHNFRYEARNILLVRSGYSEEAYRTELLKGRVYYTSEQSGRIQEINFKQIAPGNYRLVVCVEHKIADGFVMVPTSNLRLSKRSILALDLPPLYKIRLELNADKRVMPRVDGLVVCATNRAGYRNYISLSKLGQDNKYAGEWDYFLVPQSYALELTGVEGGRHFDLGKVSATASDVLRGVINIKMPDR